jgi:hypothetical protein
VSQGRSDVVEPGLPRSPLSTVPVSVPTNPLVEDSSMEAVSVPFSTLMELAAVIDALDVAVEVMAALDAGLAFVETAVENPAVELGDPAEFEVEVAHGMSPGVGDDEDDSQVWAHPCPVTCVVFLPMQSTPKLMMRTSCEKFQKRS